ncbi:ribonuclease HII [Pseudobutyrivibrio ruminis]|uniref:Ribonuclease HII n=1 Tax=Pseudobutyrivibrio ruminis DSM 9787 TaxID=1123011 RepID=A0A285R9L6_9FIRM|nr:ribonuclease HII [Pseudobutyrivibrio ruminis]SOB90574.1 RNase HII [Pseudobutyrivibrio ruminis DSM 9787]
MSEKKISEIQKEYKETSELLLPDFIEEYINDGRPGVSKIIGMAQKRMEKLRIERERIEHLKEFENQYWPEFDYIGGIDEVGRGPLAGPVVTACVVLPKDCSILYINDSKKLSASKREELYEIIMKEAVSVGIGVCSEQRIDEINILQATYEAMRQAISECSVEPQVLLNDAVTIPEVKIKQVPIIKGDAKSISIGAASIIAKVTRDRMMVEYDSIYPEYHFASNKGYGSAEHIEALKKYGPCPIHRRSFIGNFV